ncbi:MAG: hypothetical protein K6U87_03130 [Firmicutes bacterium]|nr:hypothetical protein [Bacillota bacterium]
MKAWLSQHEVAYIDRDILTEPPSVEQILQLGRLLPQGVAGLAHPRKYLDGQPANQVMAQWAPEVAAARLHQEPDLFLKPVLTDGQQLVVGPDMTRLEALLPALKA